MDTQGGAGKAGWPWAQDCQAFSLKNAVATYGYDVDTSVDVNMIVGASATRFSSRAQTPFRAGRSVCLGALAWLGARASRIRSTDLPR
jgi:hypothetical protein